MKSILAIAAFLAATTAQATAFAYILPPCSLSAEERALPAEEAFAAAQAKRQALAATVDLARLDEHRHNSKIRLTAREKKNAKAYDAILAKIGFWKRVIDLKQSLLELHGVRPPAEATAEADAIAKIIMETLYDLSQKWRIGSSAILNNMLINLGAKEKGFCYHYAAKMRKALSQRSWNQFEDHWGIAWDSTFRENNALVITAKGRPFASGLVIDPWRTAGKPFWTLVKGDRFPWAEGIDIEKRYDVE